jgi:hypothetical protein
MGEQQLDGDLQVEIAGTHGPVASADPGDFASSPLCPRLTPRRWALRLALAVALLLVVGVLLRSSAFTPQTPSSATPTPLGPIVLLSNVSYGSVTLDGRRLAGPPPLVMTFHEGTNVIALMAPPFGTESCQIDWPSGNVREGPCSTDKSPLIYTIRSKALISVLVVTLDLTGSNMSPELQAAALAAIAQAVSAVHLDTTVPAGSYIATGRDATGRITFRRTTTPLAADLSFTLDIAGPRVPGCPPWCGGQLAPEIASRLVGQVSLADVDVSLQWRFGSGGAATVRSAVYRAAPVTLAIVYDASTGWQVSPAATQIIDGAPLSSGLAGTACSPGIEVLRAVAPIGYSVNMSSNRGIEGCELELVAYTGASKATFIWRFGVLLAVDAGARRLAPALLVAPRAEIVAVSG